jgi:hypothetical protein
MNNLHRNIQVEELPETSYYKTIGKESDLRERYRLPGRYLHGLGDPVPGFPEAPTVVLINSRSGGRAGPDLTTALRRAIGHSQVRVTTVTSVACV